MTRHGCPDCGGDVVWRPDPSEVIAREAERGRDPHGAWGYIVGGLFVSAVGALVLVSGDGGDEAGAAFFGLVLLLVGGTANAIGVIAEGVRLGRLMSPEPATHNTTDGGRE